MSNGLMDSRRDAWGLGDPFFNNFARNFFGGTRDGYQLPNILSGGNTAMKTDVSENDKAYTVKIDLPGLKKENIQIDYADGVLTVAGRQSHESEAKDDEGDVIRSERYYGSYSRQYQLPHVKRDGIKASYDGGVLTLSLPKAADSETASRIAID